MEKKKWISITAAFTRHYGSLLDDKLLAPPYPSTRPGIQVSENAEPRRFLLLSGKKKFFFFLKRAKEWQFLLPWCRGDFWRQDCIHNRWTFSARDDERRWIAYPHAPHSLQNISNANTFAQSQSNLLTLASFTQRPCKRSSVRAVTERVAVTVTLHTGQHVFTTFFNQRCM